MKMHMATRRYLLAFGLAVCSASVSAALLPLRPAARPAAAPAPLLPAPAAPTPSPLLAPVLALIQPAPAPEPVPEPAPAPAADLEALRAALEPVLMPPEGGQLPTLDETLQSLMPAPAPGLNTPQGPLTAETVQVGGVTRHFLLHTPISEINAQAPKGNRPVVLVLHGLRQSAQQMAGGNSGQIWRLAADGLIPDVIKRDAQGNVVDQGFYVAFLSGATAGNLASGPAATGTWNDCEAVRFNNASTADDVAFAKAVVDGLNDQINVGGFPVRRIDTGRVYAYGFSNGAGMALRLGREAGNLVSAVAAISGVDPNPANDQCSEAGIDGISARRPALIVHGTADLLVPYTNQCSTNSGALGGNQTCRFGHLATVEAWKASAGANSAAMAPRRVFPKSGSTARPPSAAADTTRIECLQHVREKVVTTFGTAIARPADNVRVEDCTVTGGGHVEPSILTYVGAVTEASFGKQNNDAESVVQAWQFFERHRR